MTGPRTAMFQRKGGDSPPMPDKKPSLVIAIGHGDPHPEGSTQDNKGAAMDGGENSVTCPNCNCTFDPESGQIMDMGDDLSGDSGSDSGSDASSYGMPPGMMPGMPSDDSQGGS